MNAKKQTYSDITLPEFGGLMRDMMDKLTGKRAQFWFRALKRLLRRENVWPNFEKLAEEVRTSYRAVTGLLDENTLIEDLKKLGVSVDDSVSKLAEWEIKKRAGELTLGNHQQYDVIAVRLGDLLSRDEMEKLTVEEVLTKAEECGFDRSDLWSGLLVAKKLAQETKKATLPPHMMGTGKLYVICTKVLKAHGDDKWDRLPSFHLWLGDQSKDKLRPQGTVTLDGVRAQLPHPDYQTLWGDMLNPETRLVFKLVNE